MQQQLKGEGNREVARESEDKLAGFRYPPRFQGSTHLPGTYNGEPMKAPGSRRFLHLEVRRWRLGLLSAWLLMSCGKEPKEAAGVLGGGAVLVVENDLRTTMAPVYSFSSSDLLRQLLVEQALCSANIGMLFGPSGVIGQAYVRKNEAAAAKSAIETCSELSALDAREDAPTVPTDAQVWRRSAPLTSAAEVVEAIGETRFARLIRRAFKRDWLSPILASHSLSMITLRVPTCGSCGRQCKQLQLWEMSQNANVMRPLLDVILLDNSDYGKVYIGDGADITPHGDD